MIGSTPQVDPLWAGQKFLIIGHQVSRLGDLASAFKVANALHERQKIPAESIVLGTNEPENAVHFNRYQFTVLNYAQVEKIQGITLQIIMSASSEGDAIYFLKNGIHTLIVYENGYFCPPNPLISEEFLLSRSLGVDPSKKEIGIFIDEELYEWGFSKNERTPLERIQMLSRATRGLQRALLEEGEFNQQAQKFTTDSLLYMGYASKDETKEAYLQAVLELNSSDHRNLTVVFPGSTSTDIFSENNLQVGKLIVKRYHKQTGAIEKVMERGCSLSDKTLTVITGYLDYSDVKYLWLASEKETITTGDNTPSEAAAANKSWAFEENWDKENFAISLNKIRQSVAPRALPFCLDRPTANQILQIFRTNREDLYQSATTLNRTLCERFNCWNQIQGLIETLLKSRSLSRNQPFLRLPKDFIPKQIPFHALVLLDLDQVSRLRIDQQNRSSLPGFEDSIFQIRALTGDYYFMKREPIGE